MALELLVAAALAAAAPVSAQLKAASEEKSAEKAGECREAWKPEYVETPGLERKVWDGHCAKGLTPKQILALVAASAAPSLPAPSPVESGAGASLPAAEVVDGLSATVTEALSKDVASLYGESSFSDAEAAVSGGLSTGGGGPSLPAGEKKTPRLDGTAVPEPAASSCAPPFSGGPQWYQTASQQLACLPAVPYRRAIMGYLELTGLHNYGGPHVGASNSGLNKFYGGLVDKDPEFRAQVIGFYGRVAGLSPEEAPKPGRRNTLGDVAGEGPNQGVEPGWVWKEALKSAKDDPNLAMRLIGFCGHDNTAQSPVKIPRTPEQAKAAMEAERVRLTANIAKRTRALKGAACEEAAGNGMLAMLSLEEPSTPEELCQWLRLERGWLAGLKIEDFNVESRQVCPSPVSSFYLPRSLDRDADVADDLKKKVARIQKGGEDRLAQVPAKYYHVLGAAASTCELIRNGAPAWIAETVQGKAAWTYRTLRMKTDAEIHSYKREEFRLGYEEYVRGLGKGEAALDEEAWRERTNEEALVNGTRRMSLTHMDAFELMDRWGYGGTVLGVELPPLDFRLGWLAGKFFKSRPEGWSDKRFEAAKARMETFFIDWEWTVAGHEAGAAFAAKVCRDKNASDDGGLDALSAVP